MLKNRIERLNVNNCKALQVCKELTGLYTHKNRFNGELEPLHTYMLYENIIRPCYTSGSGRFTTNIDYTDDICHLLDLLKIKYVAGNDSSRGGKCGNFIKILTKIDK